MANAFCAIKRYCTFSVNCYVHENRLDVKCKK